MSKSLDSVSKKLISSLLQPRPEDRLGNGTEESGKSIEDLKKHPFFEGIIWEEIGVKKAPFEFEIPFESDSEDELIGM